MKLDVEKYISLIDELDMSRAEKEESIRLVWGIMEHCIDQVFHTHPVQIILAEKQKNALALEKTGIDSELFNIQNAFNEAKRDSKI